MSELPVVKFDNLFEQDRTGQKLWAHWLGGKTFEKFRPRFRQMGKMGAEATPLSQTADRLSPRLQNFNAAGLRIDTIEYNPAYIELQKMSYGQGIIALKYDPAFLREHKNERHLLGFAIAYYFAQTETGLFCPICMTDALGRVLERHNTHPMAQKALKHVAATDLAELWQGAMFLTEKQGGSDVGANTVSVQQKNGRWFLSGEKWFCSNADAKAILALARMPGAEGSLDKGTKGLGLFLILRDEPQKNHSSWIVHRLKDKLGVRSMASGEITFQDTEGFLIGGAGEGFKIMAEMVNMSRVYNAVSSLAIVRRSLMEAYGFGQQRKAFGHTLTQLPLWRACIADLAAEHLGLTMLVFESVRQLDKADQGDKEAGQLLRLITPLAKAMAGKLSVFAASEAMELIGGNAYIEEHIMPRLLRDAQVLPIWEGTTNIQSLDFIRALQKEGPEALIQRCQNALDKGSPALKKAVSDKLTHFKKTLESLAKASPEEAQRTSRQALEDASRVLCLSLLLELSANSEMKDIAEAAAQRLWARPSPTGALGGSLAKDLAATEDILLNSIF